MSTVLILVLVVFLLVGTLAPLSRNPVWWIRCWEFPRLQLAVLIVLAIVLIALFPVGTPVSSLALQAIMAGCLAWQLRWIVLYLPFAPNEVRGAEVRGAETRAAEPTDARPADRSNDLRLLSSNVLMSNRDTDRLINLIERIEPDLFVTLETDTRWERQLDRLADRYPFASKCPLDNRYGMHVYSSLPIEEVETRFLIEDDVPSMRMNVVLRSGRRVLAHFIHPKPPSPTENETSAPRDAELITVGREAARASLPVIVAGDLNDVAWSRTTRQFSQISGLLDPRKGRGMFNTFHADYPFLRYPLDHVFHSGDFSLLAIERLPSIGSDHFPIMVELRLEAQEAGVRH